MAGQSSGEERLAALERRLRHLEDEMEICRLLATYGPAVDSRAGATTADLWTDAGRYDFGGEPLAGREAIEGLVDIPTHVDYVEKGCAHVIGMPLVVIDGDRASATGYSMVCLHDRDGWKVERASANRWELTRTQSGWKVENRINRLMDGSQQGRDLLSRALIETARESSNAGA